MNSAKSASPVPPTWMNACLDRASLKSAFGVALAVGVLGAGQAKAFVVDVNGQSWNVTTFTGSLGNNIEKFSPITADGGVMPWFGDILLALDFATAVGTNLGLYSVPFSGNFGPYFAYDFSGVYDQTAAVNFLATQAVDTLGGTTATGIVPGVVLVATQQFSSFTWAQAVLADSDVSGPPRPPPANTAAVPGPLPALVAVAAFGFSRKLRKRIKGSTNAVSSTYSL